MLFSRKHHTRRTGLKLLTLPMVWAKRAFSAATFTRKIPARPSQALTGSQFADRVLKVDAPQREQAILSELRSGNLPNFLRSLTPVQFKFEPANAKPIKGTIFVMPDYLAIGSDDDFLRIPMNFHSAAAITAGFGFLLPTRKMVDAIYDQSPLHFTPQPLPAGPEMRSTEYYRTHNEMIEKQSSARGFRLGSLVSGHKKDVVITNRLAKSPGQIAIYGWHRASGDPIQPLSTVHGANYADYSHGIRLISETAIVDDKPRSIFETLQDSRLANVFSDEGVIRVTQLLANV